MENIGCRMETRRKLDLIQPIAFNAVNFCEAYDAIWNMEMQESIYLKAKNNP